MKRTQSYLQAAYARGKGWVKNAGNLVAENPFLMAGPLLGGAVYALNRVAIGPMPQARPDEPRHMGIPAHMLRRSPQIAVPAGEPPGQTLAQVLRQPGMVQRPVARRGGMGDIVARE